MKHQSALLIIAALATGSCDQGKKGGGGGPPEQGSSNDVKVGYTSLILTESASASLTSGTTAPTNCVLGLSQTVRGEGVCLPAGGVEVWASGVSLGSQRPQLTDGNDPASGGPGRILGGGSGFAKSGYLEGAKIDLTRTDTLRGEDNLFHKYDARPSFDLATVEAAYVRTHFTIKDAVWELLVPFYQQPVESEPVLLQCYDQGYIDEAKANANVLPGISFQAGDLLFCKRSDPATACNLTDFGWFDSASQSVVSVAQSRPAGARQLKALAKLQRKCTTPSRDGKPPDASFQMPGLRADLESPIKVYADFSHGAGSKSNPNSSAPAGVDGAQWQERCSQNLPVSPHFVYFLESSDGTTKTGNKLNVKLNIDTSDWIYVDGLRSGDLATASEAQILANLTTKEFYAWEKIGFDFIGGVPAGWRAKLEASVETVSLDELYAKAPPNTTPCQGEK